MNSIRIGAASALVILNKPQGGFSVRNPEGRTVGYVYAIKGGEFLKIGHSWSPAIRLAQLQTGFPLKLDLAAKVKTKHPKLMEAAWHSRLREYRTSGEWFKLPKSVLKSVLRSIDKGIFPDREGVELEGLIDKCALCPDGRVYRGGHCFQCGAYKSRGVNYMKFQKIKTGGAA